MSGEILKVGTAVTFLGYSDTEGMEEAEMILDEGTEGTIVEINKKDEIYVLEVPNPDFDDSKRASAKSNPKTIRADAFFEEVEVAGEEAEEQEEEKAPAKKATTKKKAAAKKKATPPKGRATPKKKAAAKAKPAEEEETEEDNAPTVDADGRAFLEDEDPEVLGLVEGISNEELLELAHEKVEEASTADYTLGGILYHVRLTGAYQDVKEEYGDKGGFELYINEELGMEYRKAMYLIDIYYKFNQYGIGSEVVADIGWTKASQIARVMNEDNADALIEVAQSSTVADLKDAIREDFTIEDKGTGKKTATTPAKKKVTFKFRLFEDQAGPVEQYLSQAQDALGLSDLNQAFEYVVSEWASEHLDVRASQAAKRKAATKKAAVKKAPARKTTAAKAPARKVAPKKKAATKKAPVKRKTVRR